MGSIRIRFSDVLRYFILGGIEFLLYLFVIYDKPIMELVADCESFPPSLMIALLCIGLYLLGFITQSVIQLLFEGDFFGTGLGEIADFIRFYPKYWLNKRDYPDWLYWSDNPRHVIDIYKNVIETEDCPEANTEFLYSNQLFQGVLFAILMIIIYEAIHLCRSIEGKNVWLFISIAIIILWILHRWGRSQIKVSIIIHWCAPIIIFLAVFLTKNSQGLGIKSSLFAAFTMFAAFLLSLLFATVLARKQIQRLDIFANFNAENSKRFYEILVRVGIPKAYILTRTNTAEFIEEELESIAKQTYPNIKVIVLADNTLQECSNKEELSKLIRIVESYQKGEGKGQDKGKPMNIQLYESSRSGPAALAYDIRQIFLNYANSDDIAITLDSDDKLYSRSVVAQIVTRLQKTQSNICLIRFEIFGKENLNYSKNYHNELVKELCYDLPIEKMGTFRIESDYPINTHERSGSILPEELLKARKLYRISTIGWTKCYKKDVINKYQCLLKDYNKDFDQYQKYEDFPDIMALMDKSSRICAVAKNSIMFRKRANSVTTSITPDNYNQIIYFLSLAKKLAEKQRDKQSKQDNYELIENGETVIIDRLIPYKFVQYLNVIYKKTIKGPFDTRLHNKYSCDEFYKHFITNVLGVEIDECGRVCDFTTLNSFHKNVLSIINGDDYDILNPEEFPRKQDHDNGADVIKNNSSWADISRAYMLTQLKNMSN